MPTFSAHCMMRAAMRKAPASDVLVAAAPDFPALGAAFKTLGAGFVETSSVLVMPSFVRSALGILRNLLAAALALSPEIVTIMLCFSWASLGGIIKEVAGAGCR